MTTTGVITQYFRIRPRDQGENQPPLVCSEDQPTLVRRFELDWNCFFLIEPIDLKKGSSYLEGKFDTYARDIDSLDCTDLVDRKEYVIKGLGLFVPDDEIVVVFRKVGPVSQLTTFFAPWPEFDERFRFV